MAEIVGPPAGAVRNRPITAELNALLNGAADQNGIQRVVIVSGGQTSNHAPELENVVGGWTGSRRHDDGRAADIELIRDGVKLSFSDADGSQVAGFVTAAAARGANGIGAGVAYMGINRIHVGYGETLTDNRQIVWGAGGRSANAAAWLRQAAQQGWANPSRGRGAPAALRETAAAVRDSGRSVVTARGGLWLRRGPGLEFDRARLLDAGTELTVIALDGPWARVDLEGDGLVDGHVFAAFLSSAGAGNADGVEEPGDAAAVEALVRGAEPAAEGGRRRTGRRRPR